MTSDPQDYIYVDLAPARPARGLRQRSRRQITIVDGDWCPVGDAAAPGGGEGRLQAHISINGLPLVVELLASELFALRQSAPGITPARAWGDTGELRVRGRQYKLLAVYAA